MENLISLVNKLQRACTALGDHGEESALPTLWDSLPAIAVVGGQVGIRNFPTQSVLFPPFSGQIWVVSPDHYCIILPPFRICDAGLPILLNEGWVFGP